jgi:lipoate-protein ligase A
MPESTSVEIQIRMDGCRDAQFNMATDKNLLAHAENSKSLFTCIRLYGWKHPSVTLGRNQDPASALDEAFCASHGIDWVHRPTGGRAVYHDRELTYAVVSNDNRLFPVGKISETYRVIAKTLQQGLQRLGITATMGKVAPRVFPKSATPEACFTSPSRYELVFRGRKLVGSAQRILQRSFLQHGSIPICLDYETAASALRSNVLHLKTVAITLNEALPQYSDLDQIEIEMARVFWETMMERWVQGAQVRKPISP